jgi:hypothetical protein
MSISDPEYDLRPFNTDSWHTTTDDAASALLHIKDTHWAMPLPFFRRSNRGSHPDGIRRLIDYWKLVKPCDYESELPFSFVAITFNLFHLEIGKKDIWNACVTNIRKLRNISSGVQITDSSTKKHEDIIVKITASPERPKNRRKSKM